MLVKCLYPEHVSLSLLKESTQIRTSNTQTRTHTVCTYSGAHTFTHSFTPYIHIFTCYVTYIHTRILYTCIRIHTLIYPYTYIHTLDTSLFLLTHPIIPFSSPSLFSQPSLCTEFNTFFIWSQIRLSAAVHAGFNPRLFDSRSFIADGVWWTLFSLYITNFTCVIKESWGQKKRIL